MIQNNLVDEYQLFVYPVVIGSGKRLFREGNPYTAMRLIDNKTTGGGVVVLTYALALHPRNSLEST